MAVNFPAKPFTSDFWIHMYSKLQPLLFPHKLNGQVHHSLPIGSNFPCHSPAVSSLSGVVVQLLSRFDLHLYVKRAYLWARLELSILHQLVIKDSPCNIMCELKERHCHVNEWHKDLLHTPGALLCPLVLFILKFYNCKF